MEASQENLYVDIETSRNCTLTLVTNANAL